MPGFRSLPEHIIEEIKKLNGKEFRVGVSRVVPMADVQAGKLKHLGITASSGTLDVEPTFLPDGVARWSKRNLYGYVITRKDWPKRTKSWSSTTPNFGDPSRGYTAHTRNREVYAKQTLHGKSFAFEVSASVRPTDGKVVAQFMLEPTFAAGVDLKSPDLLMAASLTGEVIGRPHAFALDGSGNNWANSQDFDWEFLPVEHNGAPLTFKDVAEKIGIPRTMRDTFQERYTAIQNLQPKSIWYGSTGFSRYVAFEFAKVVVLENYYYGNAAYVMYEDWQVLSQRSRLDLLSDPDAKFERVIHKDGWQTKLSHAVLGARGIS